jgi:hypothetical protein
LSHKHHVTLSKHMQISVHMNGVLRTDARSLSIPLDNPERLTLWRLYVTWLAACAPYTALKRPAGVMAGDELRKHLVSILRGDVEAHMMIARAALGACHVDHLPHVLKVCRPGAGMSARYSTLCVAQ